MIDTEFIQIEREGPILTVWLDRGRIHNAINAGMIEELTKIFEKASGDDTVRVMVLGGRGRSFCVGADIKWMLEKGDASEAENREDSLRLSAMLRALYDCPKPTIARIHGLTIGGGNGLVAACDLAVASEDAVFRVAETKLGIVPAVISPYLFRRLGEAVCREIFLTAGNFSALKAKEFGLINDVVPAEGLDEAVERWIGEILCNGPKALLEAKKLLNMVSSMTLDDAQVFTADVIARLRSSPEGREGMTAFFERRDPSWVVRRD